MNTSAPNRDQTVLRLLAAETEIRRLGVRRLALFGSVSRGEARPGSDVDLLVEFAAGQKSFDRFMAPSELLERLVGHHVELVTIESLFPLHRPPHSG
jgi:hypothetical protein